MQTIIATIKPEHLRNIMCGFKSYEIRKTAPQLKPPFRVLCCESGSGGQIKAEFICTDVKKIYVSEYGLIDGYGDLFFERACISRRALAEYIGFAKAGCAWQISFMVNYCNTKGKRVRNVSDYGLTRAPQSWQYVKYEDV